jgi:hypothetical protein
MKRATGLCLVALLACDAGFAAQKRKGRSTRARTAERGVALEPVLINDPPGR